MLVVLAFGLLTARPLRGNWGGEAGGSVATGTFKAQGTDQVEMLKENLIIRLYRDRAKVEVDYLLHNVGRAIEVKAGFPSLGLDIEGEKHREIENYTIIVGGQGVAYAREKGDPAPFKSVYWKELMEVLPAPPGEDGAASMLLEWLVSTVHFGRGESKRIHISYESLYAHSEGGYSDDATYNDDRFHYLLSTGAAWKGPIREGSVTIQAVTVDGGKLIVLPGGRFQKTADGLVWEFHNLKPSIQDNIEINLDDHLSSIFDYTNESTDEGAGRSYVAEGGKYYFDSHNYVPHAAIGQQGYPAANVRDYDSKTEWRTAHSPGLGETLALEIKPAAHIDQIGIIPGCGSDKAEWYSHSRIRELEV
jgi:hypothetical protein